MSDFKDTPEIKWSSFMPALGYALARTTGPVLELGIGHFPTPFLHEYCGQAVRGLYSVEQNPEWMGMFKGRYQNHNHYFILGEYDDIAARLSAYDFGVVLIDSSPGGDARKRLFLSFIGHSDFVLVHDYHRENEEAIKPLLANVSHAVFSDYDPPTLLASARYNISDAGKPLH